MSRPERISKTEAWVIAPLDKAVRSSLARIALEDDVRRIAVMPDVHLSKDACVGVVIATRTGIYPQAVGSDIGCGMAAARLSRRDWEFSDRDARNLLNGLQRLVPASRHGAKTAVSRLPDELTDQPLSANALEAHKRRDGRVQFATLGRGNHFLELQQDESGDYWVMVHTGSRAMGRYITEHHLKHANGGTPLKRIDADSQAGRNYLNDLGWARRYAELSRLSILTPTELVFEHTMGARVEWDSVISCEHNHVQVERHFGELLWVHRKGAAPAGVGVPGIVPGSMGSSSFHTRGRGCSSALCSSSHGAGRVMSRTQARHAVSLKALSRQMRGVWFDSTIAERLRDEAPEAYKDIGKVMRAQRELTAVVRKLRPILSYKGT
ncbi:MAG: RtcB family protein [Gammaproteobacteria bacterium]|nr:RtcB family protein [Gammaproteobacteria bacterium]